MSENGFRKFRDLPCEEVLDNRKRQRDKYRKQKKQRRALHVVEIEQEVKENGHGKLRNR